MGAGYVSGQTGLTELHFSFPWDSKMWSKIIGISPTESVLMHW